ncbi:MAG: TIGR01906 family membrane protein [Thermotaleaceae bacterium]
MTKSKHRIIYMVLGILLSTIILLTSIQWIAFNIGHYKRSFEKYNISAETGMDKENLEYVMRDLLAYLRDEREVLDTRAVVKGKEREVFGERERLHMIDVKELFIKGEMIRNISLLLLGALMVFLIFTDNLWKRNLSKILLYTSIGNLLLLGLFLVLIYFDFNRYFTYFHLIFFDNDLWILDPETEILIQMVPEGFFYDTARKIISIFIGSMGASGALGYISLQKKKA